MKPSSLMAWIQDAEESIDDLVETELSTDQDATVTVGQLRQVGRKLAEVAKLLRWTVETIANNQREGDAK